MCINTYAKGFFYRFFDALDSGIAKFYNFFNFFVRVTFINHQVIVLFVKIRFFVGRRTLCFFSKLMFSNQPSIKKNLDGVINGSLTDVVFLLHHQKVKIIYIEMMLHIIDLFQNGISFGCITKSFVLKVLLQNIFYCGNVKLFLFRIHNTKLVKFSGLVVMLSFDFFYPFDFDGLIQEWSRFYNNVMTGNTVCCKIITSQFFNKIIDAQNNLVSNC